MHRLHLESAAADQKGLADVLAVSRMSESERLVRQTWDVLYRWLTSYLWQQLLTQIRGKVLFVHVQSVSDYDLGDIHMGKILTTAIFFKLWIQDSFPDEQLANFWDTRVYYIWINMTFFFNEIAAKLTEDQCVGSFLCFSYDVTFIA